MTGVNSKSLNQSAHEGGRKQENDEICNPMENLSISRGKNLTGNKRAWPDHSPTKTHSSNDRDTTLSGPTHPQRPLQAPIEPNQLLPSRGVRSHASGPGSASYSRRSAREKTTEGKGNKIERKTARNRTGEDSTTVPRSDSSEDPSTESENAKFAGRQREGHVWVAVHTQYLRGDSSLLNENMTMFLDCGGRNTLITECVYNESVDDWGLREIRGQRPTDFPYLVAMVYIAHVRDVPLYRQCVVQTLPYRDLPGGDSMYHWVVAVLRRMQRSELLTSNLQLIANALQYAFWDHIEYTLEQSGLLEP